MSYYSSKEKRKNNKRNKHHISREIYKCDYIKENIYIVLHIQRRLDRFETFCASNEKERKKNAC